MMKNSTNKIKHDISQDNQIRRYDMEIRTACSPEDEKNYDTMRLRKEFLIDDLFREDEIKLVYR